MKNYITVFLKDNPHTLLKFLRSIVLSKNIIDYKTLAYFKNAFFENRYLVFLSLGYYLLTYIISWIIGKKITGDLIFYYKFFLNFLFPFFVLILSSSTIFYMILNIGIGYKCLKGIPNFFFQLIKRYLSISNIARFIIIFSIFPLFMCSYSSIKQSVPFITNFSSDLFLYNLDKVIHFNQSPWEIYDIFVGYPPVTKLIDFCYLAWGLIFIYSLLYMACCEDRILRLRFFFSLAFCWIFIGNILAGLLASAGPCYFSQTTGINPSPYADLFSYLRTVPGIKAVNVQDALWKAFKNEVFMPLGGISAMPSMHVSIAVLLALLYKNFNRWMGWAMTIFAIIIQIGSVHLGWHYAVDGYLSGVVTIGIWLIVKNFLNNKGRESFSPD